MNLIIAIAALCQSSTGSPITQLQCQKWYLSCIDHSKVVAGLPIMTDEAALKTCIILK